MTEEEMMKGIIERLGCDTIEAAQKNPDPWDVCPYWTNNQDSLLDRLTSQQFNRLYKKIVHHA